MALPFSIDSKLGREDLTVVMKDCTGDGWEDIVLFIPIKKRGGHLLRAPLFAVALDGTSGKILWGPTDLQTRTVSQTQVLGPYIGFVTLRETLSLIDTRTGKLRTQCDILPEQSIWSGNNWPLFLFGAVQRDGVEVLLFRGSIAYPTPSKPVYGWIPIDPAAPALKYDLSSGFPGCFSKGDALLALPNSLLCLDRETGKEKWRRPLERRQRFTGGSASNAVIALYEESGHLTALSAETGAVLWRTRLLGPCPVEHSLFASPVIGSDSIAAYEGTGYGLSVIRLKDGTRAYSRYADDPVMLLRGAADGAFLVREFRQTRGFEFSTSTPLWSTPFRDIQVDRFGMSSEGGRGGADALDGSLVERLVLISRRDGRIAAVSADERSILWTREMPLALGLWFPFSMPTPIRYTGGGRYALIYGKKDVNQIDMASGKTVETYSVEDWKFIQTVLHSSALLRFGAEGLLTWKTMTPGDAFKVVDGVTVPKHQCYAIGRDRLVFIGGSGISSLLYPWTAEKRELIAARDEILSYLEDYQVLMQYFSTAGG